MWFDSNDLIYKKPIILDDLHGYVLPHAGTKYTKNIINHTLQFKPAKTFEYIKIIYYPSNNTPNVNEKWFHELCCMENRALKKKFKQQYKIQS